MTKYFRTIMQVEVLSEDPLADDLDLAEIARAIVSGDCSGRVTVQEVQELNAAQAADALRKQGSDPEFFGLEMEDEPALPDTLVKGQILRSRCGYEHTSVEFYEVQADAVLGSMVSLRKLAKIGQESTPSAMRGFSTPLAGQYDGEPFRRKLKKHSDEWLVAISSDERAYVWDGKPVSHTSYG